MGRLIQGNDSSILGMNFSMLQIFCPGFSPSIIYNDCSETLAREPIPSCETLKSWQGTSCKPLMTA